MRKWFASKESQKITVIICILCAALAVQIFGFSHFNKRLYEMSLEHSEHQVEELSVYIEKNLYLELKCHIYILEVIESQMEKEDELFSENMIRLLQQVHDTTDFRRMGISDLEGHGVDSNGDTYNISYKNIRKSIENGEVYISNVLKSEDEPLIFIAIPLKINGEIQGILWGKHALADIMEDIELANSTYKYFQIIDDQGNYLLSSKNEFALVKNPRQANQTFWVELESYHYPRGTTPQEIHERIRQGKTGSFYFESNGEGRYVNYHPLRINNWYLFSVQVDDGLHDYVYRTRDIAGNFFLVLTIGLVAIFGVIYNLIYTMYQKMAKQNREIQAINVMFRATLQQTKDIPFVIDRSLKHVALYGYPTKDVVQYCSFQSLQPANMLKKGILDAGSLSDYQTLYEKLIVQGTTCPPVVVCLWLAERKEWIRISITSDTQDNGDQMIGVLEDYGEQREKELQIENHLDDIKKIEQRSKIDFLTNLYNREAILEKVQLALEESVQNQQTSALLILDLDHFKDVNDCMGHGMGDVVLQKTANTLLSFFRKGDIVGRLGGDEFVVFVQNIRDVPAFQRRIEALNQLLYKVYQKDGKEIQVSASIGIMFTDAEHTTFDALYEKADQALYRVKQAGRNGYQLYTEHSS